MITAREVYGYGLTTGLTFCDMQFMKPGFVLDMVIIRKKYLSSIFGVKKK